MSSEIVLSVANRQHQVLALLLGLVTDALNFERLLVPFSHADDHVGQQRTGQAVQRLALLFVIGPRDDEFILGRVDGPL